MGDVILTTGVLKRFAETVDAEINVLTSERYGDIFRVLPSVKHVYVIKDRASLSEYIKALGTLPNFDVVADLHANIRSFIACRLLRKRKVLVYRKKSLSRRLYAAFRIGKPSVHTVIKYAEILEGEGLKYETAEELRPCLIYGERKAKPRKVIIHPFASKFTKVWQHFEELTADLGDYEVVIVGSGDGKPASKHIKTDSLKELETVMYDAALVISTDSGPMHMAIGLGIPTLAIFCGTSKELGFYPEFAGCKVAEAEGVRCRPCHVHGLAACPRKHFKCGDIACETVAKIARAMLG